MANRFRVKVKASQEVVRLKRPRHQGAEGGQLEGGHGDQQVQGGGQRHGAHAKAVIPVRTMMGQRSPLQSNGVLLLMIPFNAVGSSPTEQHREQRPPPQLSTCGLSA